MEEHFNENYMESDKIPYSTLDAVIKEKIDFTKDGVYDVTLVGTLDLHGVKVPREVKGKLTVKGGAPVSATADFMVKLSDHKIKIPSVVGVNIAEELKVDVAFDFVKYEKK
jgi:polyisoprenoid-binding protein YceI